MMMSKARLRSLLMSPDDGLFRSLVLVLCGEMIQRRDMMVIAEPALRIIAPPRKRQ